MNAVKALFLSVFFATLFIGCSSKEVSPSRVEVKSDKGIIIVYRPHNRIWKHKRFNVYINGDYQDILMNRGQYIFNKKPGLYEIELREDIDIKPEIFKVKVELNEGKVKYIKFGTQNTDGHLKLKNVMKSIALGDEWYKKRY